MPYVQIPGARIWYQIKGKDNEVIAQIHGAGFGHDNFATVSPLLAKNFKVLDYDMRGYGLSDRPKQKYSMESWADDLNDMLNALKIPRAHIHGTSMGGMVALKFTVKYPAKVKSLIVGCTACKADKTMKLMFGGWKYIAQKEGMGSRLLAETLGIQALAREFMDGPQGLKNVEQIRVILEKNNDVRVFSAACQAMIDLDLTHEIRKIRSPTLILVGDQDVMTPLDQGPIGGGSRVIHDQIRNSTLKILKGCGHTFLFERPEESARLVTSFVNKQVKS